MFSTNRVVKILDFFSYMLLLLAVVAVPLFLDKNIANFYIIPKQFIFLAFVSLALLALTAKTVLSKKVLIVHSAFDWPTIVMFLIILFSTIFSVSKYDSWLGRSDYFVFNAALAFGLVVYYFLIQNQVSTPRRWQGMVETLILVNGLTAFIFILKTVFHFDAVALLLGGEFWNTIDVTNSGFGLWLLVGFVLSAGQLIKKNLSINRTLIYFFISFITFSAVILLGFSLVWWLAFGALLLLLFVGISFLRSARLGWLTVLFCLLIVVSILLLFGSPSKLGSIGANVPTEISLSAKSSWVIGAQALMSSAKNFLIGTGPGSFAVDFSQFRDAAFNNDQFAWSLRFNRPFNTFFAVAIETGVLSVLAGLFIFMYFVGHLLSMWFREKQNNLFAKFVSEVSAKEVTTPDVFIVAAAWLITFVGMAILFYGPALWFLTALLFSLTVSGFGFHKSNLRQVIEFKIEDAPEQSLVFTFACIVVTAMVAVAGVWGIKFYLGEYAYTVAIKNSNLAIAEQSLLKAISERSTVDSYYVALAQVYLLQAVSASREANIDREKIGNLLAKAVNSARSATNISPRSVAIWENLATMYENASAIVPGARDWAINSLKEASRLEPTNPVLLWRLGNNRALMSKWEDAAKEYKAAIELKKDYAAAYLGLSAVQEQLKQTNQAIQTLEKILSLANNNVDVLYNYGRLLFNRNSKDDRETSRRVWVLVTSLQPNYANALYSLGLWYEYVGDKSTALQFYYRVKDLNPTNKEVLGKISALVGGNSDSSSPKP